MGYHNHPHGNTMFSSYVTKLWGQTNKPPQSFLIKALKGNQKKVIVERIPTY